jgi:hypothetical protein
MELTTADRVWNRAAMASGGPNPGEGDRALAALLLAHGMVMNGGVEHAIEALSPSELSAAAAGYRFFSFNEVARLLEEIAGNEFIDSAVDQRYAELVPTDMVIVGRFRDLFSSSPSVFSPL